MTDVLSTDPLARVVQRVDLDDSFRNLRATIVDPNLGLFGPDSMIWRMVSPIPVLPLALSAAGLLEAPHPYIAVGTEGTKSSVEYIPRFHRSVDMFLAWFVGDWDRATRAARRVYGMHTMVHGEIPEKIGRYEQGHAYAANETEPLLWVWATIVRPVKEIYERFHGRLSPGEVIRYYDEAKLFSQLFGIDQALVPKSWTEFTAYFDAYAASDAMDLRGEFLTRKNPLSEGPTGPFLQRSLLRLGFVLIADVLPTNVRRQYPTIVYRRREQVGANMAYVVLRVLWFLTPRELHDWPRCRAARRRVGAQGEPGRLGRWLDGKLPSPYDSASDRRSTVAD